MTPVSVTPRRFSLRLVRTFFRSGVLLASLFLFAPPVLANNVFQESGGIVVMEVESEGTTAQWSRESDIGGFRGQGYYVWRGEQFFNPASAGRGTITYRFRINTPGNYEMRWRSYIAHGNLGSDHNDSWARFPSGRNIPGQHGLNGWTKVYQGHLNRWSWDALTVDFVGHKLRQYFSAGEHTMQISGRSFGHAIDRIALYRYEDMNFDPSRFDNLPQSSRNGSSEPAPAPAPVAAPEPEPEPEPTPEPAPEPDPEPAPVPVVEEPAPTPQLVAEPDAPTVELVMAEPETTAAPVSDDSTTTQLAVPVIIDMQVYSSTAAEIFWGRGDASIVSYDIFMNGQYLDSSNGTSYFFDSLNPGVSYSVAIRSVASNGEISGDSVAAFDTVSNAGAQGNSALASPQGASLLVYSSTAAELFWTRAPEVDGVVGTDVYRDGLFIGVSPGNSYFDDTREPGQQYQYELIANDASGRSSNATVVAE